jgi:hypothetical protein
VTAPSVRAARFRAAPAHDWCDRASDSWSSTTYRYDGWRVRPDEQYDRSLRAERPVARLNDAKVRAVRPIPVRRPHAVQPVVRLGEVVEPAGRDVGTSGSATAGWCSRRHDVNWARPAGGTTWLRRSSGVWAVRHRRSAPVNSRHVTATAGWCDMAGRPNRTGERPQRRLPSSGTTIWRTTIRTAGRLLLEPAAGGTTGTPAPGSRDGG